MKYHSLIRRTHWVEGGSVGVGRAVGGKWKQVYLNQKKKGTTYWPTQHVDESPENYTKWKEPISKGYRLYYFISITALNWQNQNWWTCGFHRIKRGQEQGTRERGYKEWHGRAPCQGPGWGVVATGGNWEVGAWLSLYYVHLKHTEKHVSRGTFFFWLQIPVWLRAALPGTWQLSTLALPDLPDADLGYMVRLQNRLFEDRTLLGNLGYDTFGVPIILAVILAVLLFGCFIGFF